ncbi:MAG TPA: SusC/RagA family TonB-linked outer membrane protein [Pelobium sp.]|nr:SusC/RagA family TonB-linked outer membrane protein [Pelobium sp.]
MIKKIYIFLFAFIFILLEINPYTGYSQNKEQTKKNKKSSAITISSKVVDENGKPIPNATVIVGEGLFKVNTTENGDFKVEAKADAVLLIQAFGYQQQSLDLSTQAMPTQISLTKSLLLSSDFDIINLPLNKKTTQRELVGAVSKVSGEELKKYPDLSLSNTLQGKLAGLYVRSTSSGLGNNSSELYVRGLSRAGADGALVLVDGIERPLDFINPNEVENVEVLKDALSKIIYGPRAANGVVLVTTKRGTPNTRSLNVSTEYGMSQATRLPEYLNSYQYVQLYNQARANDGLTPFYTPQQIEGYKNSTGPDDQEYPDVDYYDYFLRNSTPIKKVNIDYTGGGKGNEYALMLGYTGAEGFEKIGKTPVQDRINLRGNLDFQISPSFKAFVDASGIVERRVWSGFNQDQVFSALSNYRNNENPIFLTDSTLLSIGSPLGLAYVPPLGGSFERPSSLYGNLVYGGKTQHNYFYGQTNFGLDLNLDKLVKGFAVKTVFNFDNYQFFQSGRSLRPVTYARQMAKTSLGADTVVYVNLQKRITANNDTRQAENITRNYGFSSTLSYQTKFDNSDFKGSLTHFYYKNENSGIYQDIENTNSVLNLNYAIKNKIYLDGSVALMGSSKYADANKYNFFPAVGFGWILSDENFLKDVKKLNFFKLKASFGVLGYERGTAFYLYNSRWNDNGTYAFGQPNATNGVMRSSLSIVGNPDLGWEKSREINIGIEGLAFNNRVNFEFNYFNNLRYDIVIDPGSQYSALAGQLYPRLNGGETSNAGVEGNLNYQTKIGKVDFNIGGNFIYSKNNVKSNADVLFADENLRTINQSSDVIFGYVAKGLFKSQAEIDAAPFQTFGAYQVGDIAYEDLNSDDVIDGRDRKIIGNNFPRAALGLNLNLRYKNFGLYALGTAEFGAERILNNSYYRNNGEANYSTLALESYSATNTGGKYPRLSTLSQANNNVNSTFWLQNASFFRLKNVELSYSVGSSNATVKNYQFFVRGTNLFVLSENKDLDPEVINAGVTNYPIYSTYSLGAAVKF